VGLVGRVELVAVGQGLLAQVEKVVEMVAVACRVAASQGSVAARMRAMWGEVGW
jgi:hypothetical protein